MLLFCRLIVRFGDADGNIYSSYTKKYANYHHHAPNEGNCFDLRTQARYRTKDGDIRNRPLSEYTYHAAGYESEWFFNIYYKSSSANGLKNYKVRMFSWVRRMSWWYFEFGHMC